MAQPQFADQVFINCPFDDDYRPLFRAIVFAVIDCGFTPRCALEAISGAVRLQRIVDIVRECKYGIHDLSRVELSDGLPRFNMPFELGIFLGARYVGDTNSAQSSGSSLRGSHTDISAPSLT
jgi:hypothetical protein